jgi:hypothetical protein
VRQHLPAQDRVALLGQQLDQGKPFDLGIDQDLVAGDQGAGQQDGFRDGPCFGLDHADRRRLRQSRDGFYGICRLGAHDQPREECRAQQALAGDGKAIRCVEHVLCPQGVRGGIVMGFVLAAVRHAVRHTGNISAMNERSCADFVRRSVVLA